MKKREDLLRYCGSLEQIAYVRPVIHQDGPASGLSCIQVKNDRLEYSLMADKCLDPSGITYQGMNLSFLSKPGLQGHVMYTAVGDQGCRSIMGGAMMTCGLEHIHGATEIEGSFYPSHGRMRATPASKVSMDAHFVGEDYLLEVSGEMREAELFGENLVLRRRVTSVYGKNEITFQDTIENQAFREEPLCFLYHCNFGYPFLTEDTQIWIPSLTCQPRDEDASLGLDSWNHMSPPQDQAPEQVFLHTCACDKEGNTFAAAVRRDLNLAVCLRWNLKQIPYLVQWKSPASGDYALALEPTNASFLGRTGETQKLPPLDSHENILTFQILEGADALNSLEKERDALLTDHA